MTALPDRSRASLRRGVWFVFDTRAHRVHVWYSAVSGRMRILVDGEPIDERRSFRTTGHVDIPLGEDTGRIEFRVSPRRRLTTTLKMPNQPVRRQAAWFHVSRVGQLLTLAIAGLGTAWLTHAVLDDTLGLGPALAIFIGSGIGLLAVRQYGFGDFMLEDEPTAPHLP